MLYLEIGRYNFILTLNQISLGCLEGHGLNKLIIIYVVLRGQLFIERLLLFQYHSGEVKLLTNESDGVIVSKRDFSENAVWQLDYVSSSEEEGTDDAFPNYYYPRVSSIIFSYYLPSMNSIDIQNYT